MKNSDIDMSSIIEEAKKRGDELKDIDKRNRKRAAKGRKPLPDPQDKLDSMVLKRRHRTGYKVTVDGADALKLYEMRKAQMDKDSEDDEDLQQDGNAKPVFKDNDEESIRAARESAAVRMIQDKKDGRIDHLGNWESGQTLKHGDETSLPHPNVPDASRVPAGSDMQKDDECPCKKRFDDLYMRLKISFDGLEKTLSDLQGRVAEIVTATTPTQAVNEEPEESEGSSFKDLLSRRTPVVFDVGGTKMTFDAICVFGAPPCITVVSNIGSAKIMPKPGSQLLLSYQMDGVEYRDDPVTFLGTRFDLPMFGLSFVGFIRDKEADLMDTAAGIGGYPGAE